MIPESLTLEMVSAGALPEPLMLHRSVMNWDMNPSAWPVWVNASRFWLAGSR